MNKQLKAPPVYPNEIEERAFWETYDCTDYLDWTKANPIVLPNLKPTSKTIS
jgi:CopG antitoxin of type II toxin-antitoxin system